AFEPSGDVWRHLVDTVLWRYVWVTLTLAGGVGLLTAAIGVGAGWLVATLDFPGRRAFEWALLLPLAMPAYIVGYVYADMLSFSGPVQGFIRAVFGWSRPQDYWFPETRTLGGAILLFSVALYP
ncbi:MAG: iron ABC transporter permease, partial [Alphaproteobacteria bacterium]